MSIRFSSLVSSVSLAALATVTSVHLTQGPSRSARPLPLLTPEQQEILSHLSLVHLPDGQGGTVKTIRVTGVNLQLVNGLGATNGYPLDPASQDPMLTQENGAGNLIVGYNEPGNGSGDERTGSHNLVVGANHSYLSHGGVLLGYRNRSLAPYSTVTGGAANQVEGIFSSISGGQSNRTCSRVRRSRAGSRTSPRESSRSSRAVHRTTRPASSPSSVGAS